MSSNTLGRNRDAKGDLASAVHHDRRIISELNSAANEVERLTQSERVKLLQRAASTIRAYREESGLSEAPASETGDIVENLDSMAETIDLVAATEVHAMRRNAIEAIKAARALVEAEMDADYQELIDEIDELGGSEA